MQQNVIFLILDFIGFILLLKWCKHQYQAYISIPKKSDFFTFKRFKYVGILFLVVLIPLLLVNYTSIENTLHIPLKHIKTYTVFYALLISFSISLVWLLYILKLDIYNKEKKRHLAIIIILAIVSTLFANFWYHLFHSFGIENSKLPLPSFLYSVFVIGLIEETVKFVPFLLVLKFTKAINEPYDYLLYAATSALSFAFVENAMYISNYGITVTTARAIYATVAHMTFSCVIAYGLFLIKYKKTKYPSYLVFPLFYLLAISSHGFYDFWLINDAVSNYNGITTIFFLITIHIWFVMKNNTINSSNFYNKNIRLNNDKLKVYLMISLLSIFMFSYVYVALVYNQTQANKLFRESVFTYGYIIFYLIATLSNYTIVKGLINPIKVRLKILFFKFRK